MADADGIEPAFVFDGNSITIPFEREPESAFEAGDVIVSEVDCEIDTSKFPEANFGEYDSEKGFVLVKSIKSPAEMASISLWTKLGETFQECAKAVALMSKVLVEFHKANQTFFEATDAVGEPVIIEAQKETPS